MIKRILVPLDGSMVSERALPVAFELAQALGGQVVLVCVAGGDSALQGALTDADRRAVDEQYAGVTEEDHLLSTDPWRVEHAQGQVRAVAEAEAYLALRATSLAEKGILVETAVPYGEAVGGILTEIELRSADLVVMARHGRSGLHGLIGRSVTQEVLVHSPVPVLFIPADRQ